jgi:tryptophan 2,3-dioxygenase
VSVRKKKPKKRPAAKKKKARPMSAASDGCPMHAQSPGGLVATDLTYNDYLKVGEMLSLQSPQSEPEHHDEMLFIIIHQTYELWFKLILHEMATVLGYLDQDDPLSAHHFLNRVVEILKLLVQQIHILQTMSPVDFLEFRDRLMPASGFQSTQFREIEFLAGLKDEVYLRYFEHRPEFVDLLKLRIRNRDLRTAYYDMMRRLGYPMPAKAENAEKAGEIVDSKTGLKVIEALRPIYQKPSKHLPAYLLTEALVDFDQYLGLWREHHVRVVERVIGFRRGTGGSSGVAYLKSTTVKKCFPLLWELRTYLRKE